MLFYSLFTVLVLLYRTHTPTAACMSVRMGRIDLQPMRCQTEIVECNVQVALRRVGECGRGPENMR
jgi:hypothetical protein